MKRDFRLVVRGAARKMVEILDGSGKLDSSCVVGLFLFTEQVRMSMNALSVWMTFTPYISTLKTNVPTRM